MREPLPDNEAHLWWISPAELSDGARARAMTWLTPAEHARRARYIRPRDRETYLVTRAMVRSVLGLYTDAPPETLRFTDNPWGRPELVVGEGACAPRFNLSNTDGMVVMLVAARCEVGVDVEGIHRKVTLAVADRFFAPDEVTRLRALPVHRQNRRFLDHWTLKESYIKARGMGLAIPLGLFGFTVEPDEAPRIAIDPSLGDDPTVWQFTQTVLMASHLVAMAVRRDTGRDIPVVSRHAEHLTRDE